MRVLLDTCVFLWLSLEPSRISAKAKEIIDNETNTLVLSHVSSWEICLKHTAGRLTLPEPPARWILSELEFFKIESAALTEAMVFRTCDLPTLHLDPFDRLLAAQAIEGGYTILSPDGKLDLLGALRIW